MSIHLPIGLLGLEADCGLIGLVDGTFFQLKNTE
jgi:hypothetical protein